MSRIFRLDLPAETSAETEATTTDGSGAVRWVLGSIIGILVAAMIIVAIIVHQHSAAGPTCSPVATQLSHIRGFFQQGQLSVVAQWSERLLAGDMQPGICASAHDQAAGYWYEAKTLPLISMPRPLQEVPVPPLALHQTALNWLTVERQADAYQVPASVRLPARLVAVMAFNEGQFELAATAFRRTWIDGMIGQTDLQNVARYSQMLTDWGRVLALPAFPDTREQGVQTLATANSIVTAYGLADQRACQALKHLGYTDCTRAAPDPNDPVLASATK